LTPSPASVTAPLAPSTPTLIYRVRYEQETLRDIARRTLGAADRWTEVARLNPALKNEGGLAVGTVVRVPAEANVPHDETESVKPLPYLRAKSMPAKSRAMPITGTYAGVLDEGKALVLPRTIRDQLGGDGSVLISPGSDICLWLTTPAHLERLSERLEMSRARETDIRAFRRLYYAQAEKVKVGDDGRLILPERLAQFASLEREVVFVGIDDHIEVWDAARWKRYTQEKSAATRAAADLE
jgi:MraZ protein